MSDDNEHQAAYSSLASDDVTLTYPRTSGPGSGAILEYPGAEGRALRPISAETSVVRITNLRHGDIVALTNESVVRPVPPVLGTARRRPANRSLLVTGTALTGFDFVEVNHQRVEVADGRWRAELPIAAPGRLDVCARAGFAAESISVYLVDARIATPPENGVFWVREPGPAVDRIEATVALDGHPFGSVPGDVLCDWSIAVFGWKRTRAGWIPYEVRYSQALYGHTPFVPRLEPVIGGVARLSVAIHLSERDTSCIYSDPRWIDIRGQDPDLVVVSDTIRNAVEPSDFDTLRRIIRHESGFRQFRAEPEARETEHTRDERVPEDLRAPQPSRPLYGAPPAGIGIAQLDPPSADEQYWNWRANLGEGVRRWNAGKARAATLAASERARLARERAAIQAVVDNNRAARGLPRSTVTEVPAAPEVAELSHARWMREAAVRYNRGAAGHNYVFNAGYRLGNDGLSARIVPLVAGPTGTWVQQHPDYADRCLGPEPNP